MPTFSARGLGIVPGAMRSMIPQLHFEPSIAIAAARVNKMGLDIRSFREPLQRAVKQVVIPSIRKNFDSEGRPTWPALSSATVSIREREGYGSGPVLNRTGQLRRVATQQNIWTFTPTSAAVLDLPSKVWYGKLHQSGFGGSGGGQSVAGRSLRAIVAGAGSGNIARPIPQRPFIMIQREDERKIENVFEKWLEERWRAAWPGV